MEGGWRHEKLVDLSAIRYDEVSGRYTFGNYLCLTPSVQGMLQELECLQRGLLYQNNDMRSALVIVIRALAMFWH